MDGVLWFFSGVYPISRQTHIESVASPGPFLLHQLVFSPFLTSPISCCCLHNYIHMLCFEYLSIYKYIHQCYLEICYIYMYMCIYIYISNFTSSWDFVIFSEYWISRSRCNIWCSVPAQGSHEKKISVMVCMGSFALDQTSINGIGLLNRSEKMKCYINMFYIYIHICHIYIYSIYIYIQYIYIYVDIPTISPSLISVRRVAMCIQDIGGRHGPTGATEALVRHLLTHRASASGNFRPQSDH